MEPARRQWVWALIAVGTVGRIVLAFAFYGQPYDIGSYFVVRDAIRDHGLHLYDVVNATSLRWPYPPGLLPWVWAAGGLSDATGLAFHGIVQLPGIAADAAIAWLVAAFLRRRGSAPAVQLAGAGLVALGPTFALVSGYHGQFDAVAILPAVGALYVWEGGGGRRALAAGALVGMGAALKTVPVVMLVALLPTVRSWREAAWLVGAAAAVLVAVSAPFLLLTPDTYESSIRHYHGFPGLGGLSLVLQPNLADWWLPGAPVPTPPHLNGAVRALYEHGGLINGAIVAGLAAFLLCFRPPAVTGAVLVWLAVYVLAPGFFFQYLVWGLPFFLMAGYLRAAALLQLVTLPPMLLLYLREGGDGLVAAYVALMIVVWLGMAGALVLTARGIVRRRPPPDVPAPAALPTPAMPPA